MRKNEADTDDKFIRLFPQMLIDGNSVVKIPIASELPMREVVFCGERSLRHKVLRLMEQEKQRKMLIKNAGADTINTRTGRKHSYAVL